MFLCNLLCKLQLELSLQGYPLACIKVNLILMIIGLQNAGGFYKSPIERSQSGSAFCFIKKKSYNMYMNGRFQKQVIIGLVFVLILGGIGYGIYSGLVTNVSCTDGIQNGKEEGVDCGSLACGKACEPAIMPISINSSKLFKVNSNDYDFVAQIYNPNVFYGASRLEYSIDAFNYRGSTYILPGQTKWLVLTALKSSQEVGDAKLVINNAQWEKMNMPNNAVNFTLRRKDYRPTPRGSELEAILYNESNFDFDKIDVAVILFDNTGKIVGVGKTDIRTFVAKSERGFNVAWPFALSRNVARQDVEASTNLFENSNFIKSYGSPEKFQKFY